VRTTRGIVRCTPTDLRSAIALYCRVSGLSLDLLLREVLRPFLDFYRVAQIS
jgi:hypothetical protein